MTRSGLSVPDPHRGAIRDAGDREPALSEAVRLMDEQSAVAAYYLLNSAAPTAGRT